MFLWVKATVTVKWEGSSLRSVNDALNSCWAWELLFRSLASDGRTTRTRTFFFLPLSPPFPTEQRECCFRIATSGTFNLKAPHGTWRISLVVSLWGSDGFFPLRRDRRIKTRFTWFKAARERLAPTTSTSSRRPRVHRTPDQSVKCPVFHDFGFFLSSLNALQIWWCHRRHFFLKLWRSATFLTSLGERHSAGFGLFQLHVAGLCVCLKSECKVL